MLVVVYDGSLCKKLGIYKLVEDIDITADIRPVAILGQIFHETPPKMDGFK